MIDDKKKYNGEEILRIPNLPLKYATVINKTHLIIRYFDRFSYLKFRGVEFD